MPDRVRLGMALPQFRCNDRPEMIHPASDCFVRNCNSALREQVLDVAKAEGEPEIKPDRLVNDLRWEQISGIADFRHVLRLPSRRRRDNALAGHGVSLRIEGGALTIQNGFTHYPQEREIIRYFRGDVALPERIILLDGSGSISFNVLSWLATLWRPRRLHASQVDGDRRLPNAG
jgi:hypothetical protein